MAKKSTRVARATLPLRGRSGPGQADGRGRRPSAGAASAATTPSCPEALPPDGAPYPQILRGASYVWWRSLLGVVCGLSLYLLMTAVVTQVVLGVSWGAVGAGEAYADFARRALAFEIPAGMIAANLGIATLIPICWVLMAIVHQVRPRWLQLGAAPAALALPADLCRRRAGGAERRDADPAGARVDRRRRWRRSRASGASWW